MTTSRRTSRRGAPCYSFCEPTTAVRNTWHIRKLGPAGQKFGGGIDTPSLCGHVRPHRPGGWDVNVEVNTRALETADICVACRDAYMRILENF